MKKRIIFVQKVQTLNEVKIVSRLIMKTVCTVTAHMYNSYVNIFQSWATLWRGIFMMYTEKKV